MSALTEKLKRAIPAIEDIQRCGYLYLDTARIKKNTTITSLAETLNNRINSCTNLRQFALVSLALLKKASNIGFDLEGRVKGMIRRLEEENDFMLSTERELRIAWEEYKQTL